MSTSDPLSDSPHGHLSTTHLSVAPNTNHKNPQQNYPKQASQQQQQPAPKTQQQPTQPHQQLPQSSQQQQQQHSQHSITQGSMMNVQDQSHVSNNTQQNCSKDEQDEREFNKRFLVSLAMILPAVAAIIGVLAWAISVEVLMNGRHEVSRRHSEHSNFRHSNRFHPAPLNHPIKELLIDPKFVSALNAPADPANIDYFQAKFENAFQKRMDEDDNSHSSQVHNGEGNNGSTQNSNNIKMPASVAELSTKFRERFQQESFQQVLAKLLENHARSQVAANPTKSGVDLENAGIVDDDAVRSSLTSSSFETVVTQTRPEGFALRRGDHDETQGDGESAGKKKRVESKKKSSSSSSGKRKSSAPSTTTTTTPKPIKSKTYEKEIDRLLEKIERLEKEQAQTTTTETPQQFQQSRGPPTVIANKIKKFMETYNPDAAAAIPPQGQSARPSGNEDDEEDEAGEEATPQGQNSNFRSPNPQPMHKSWIPDSAGSPQPMPTPPPGFPRPPPGMPPLPFMPFMPPHPMMPQQGSDLYSQYPQPQYYPQGQDMSPEEQAPQHPYEAAQQNGQYDPNAQQPQQPQYEQSPDQQLPYDSNQGPYDPNQVPYDPQQPQQPQYEQNFDANQQIESNSQQYQQEFNAFQQQAIQQNEPPTPIQPVTEAPKKSFFRKKFKLSSLLNSVIPKTKKQKQKAEMMKQQALHQQQQQQQQQQQMQLDDYSNQNYINPNRDQPQDHMVAGESQMYGNVDRGHGYPMAMEQPGLSVSMGAGPMGGGGHVKASPLGIVKTLLQPFSGRPKWLNGKIVFGVVLENGIGKKPKTVFQHFSTGRI